MAKQGAKTATPRLRFPEFRSAAGWKAAPLDQIAERISTKNRDSRVSRVLTNSAEFGVLDQRDYFDRDIATAGKVDGYYIVGKGDYVYNPRTSVIAPVGPISRNNVGEGVMSPLYTVFRFSDIQTDFYEHYFRSTGWHSYLRSAASTGARHDRMSITTDAFMRMPLPVPTPAEQQKIADCLTSLDEVIAAQGCKVDALKAHKRGLMQQLFPREGETRPRLRFPEFRDAPEWEEGRVGDTMPFVTSGSRGWAAHYADIGSLFVRITNLSRSSIFLDLSDRKFVALPPEATEGVRTQLKIDDVLISITADTGIIGYVDNSVQSPAYINQHIALVRFDGSKVSGKFVAYFLASEASQRQFRGSTDSGAKAGMNLLAVQSMKLQVPALSEQNRIADCLSSLDNQITAETNRLAALKTHKQGLMQQLFPAPDAAIP